jgi:hypothetical protein
MAWMEGAGRAGAQRAGASVEAGVENWIDATTGRY